MKTNLTVRYAETDQMGIVHHSNYAIWFEAGRTDFLKNIDVSNSSIEKKGLLLPLYEMKCKFISPARYEDEVVIETTLKKVSRVRIIFSYQVFNSISNRLLAKGETMHAFTNKNLKPLNAEKNIPEIYSILRKKVSN
ncbi:thioesterase family protein [Herbivorax sp. ANBcel31]|uniref:acyl-CoA thioesterase n=1 Tax=Herbivorax sp. ANBcel31 TaxID=3069754 RepID=UPI0027B01F33|nr:thioesterase family protein [Herbivorax sp. ANBcel31]MDQ2086252.1 thioesterase family protein [Herbivorax sp. ANBcel31]